MAAKPLPACPGRHLTKGWIAILITPTFMLGAAVVAREVQLQSHDERLLQHADFLRETRLRIDKILETVSELRVTLGRLEERITR